MPIIHHLDWVGAMRASCECGNACVCVCLRVCVCVCVCDVCVIERENTLAEQSYEEKPNGHAAAGVRPAGFPSIAPRLKLILLPPTAEGPRGAKMAAPLRRPCQEV